jgi:hypothetical protein
LHRFPAKQIQVVLSSFPAAELPALAGPVLPLVAVAAVFVSIDM